MLGYLRHMIQLILSPSRGWEDVASHPVSGREAFRHGLVPLIVIAGMSVFVRPLYQINISVAQLIPIAVIGILKYFLTYMIAHVSLSAYLPRITKDGQTDEQRLRLFLCFNIGQMCMIGIIANLLPMTLTLVEFLPLYVAVVMFKGREFMGVRSDVVGGFAGATLLSVIVPVYLFGFILNKVIL